MNKDLAYFIGIICADGYVSSKSNLVEVKSSSINFLTKIYSPLLEKLFKIKPKIIPESCNVNAFRAYVNSKNIALLLKSMGIVSPKTSTISMPNKIVSLKEQISFAKGVMDTDGSLALKKNKKILNYPTVQLECKSQKLIENITKIFLKLGLNAKPLKFKKRKGYMYAVRLYGFEQLKKFQNKIGFSHPKKKERAEKLIKIGPKRILWAGRSTEDRYHKKWRESLA